LLKDIHYYELENGSAPVQKWLNSFKDIKTKARIKNDISKLRIGLGDTKSLKDGLFELRIFYGKGYRVYFTEKDNRIILLLTAGDKSTQSKDIATAKEYLKGLN